MILEQIKIKVASVEDLGKNFDLICDIKVLSQVTKFSHTSNQNELSINDYAYMQENDTFEPQTLEFKAMPRYGDIDEFKEFYRSYNRQFIMEINNNGDIRYVLCKKDKEEQSQLYSRPREEYSFSFRTQTNYLKYKTLSYDLGLVENTEPFYSSSTPPGEDGQSYPLRYAQTEASIDYFQVPLPKNSGDRKMYIKNMITDYDVNPAFGVNAKWDDTYRAFNSSISPVDNYALVVNSFPALKKIEHQDVYNNGLPSLNVEDLADPTKQAYIYVMPGETANIVMTNIRVGVLTLYEQYSNIR